jgi:hypothetical protein
LPAGLDQLWQGADHISLEKEGAAMGVRNGCLAGKGLLMVAFDDAATVLMDKRGKRCGGIDLGRGTDHQQQVTVGDEGMDCVEIPYRFSEEDDVRFEGETAVCAKRHRLGLIMLRENRDLVVAVQAVQMLVIAVDLKDPAAAGLLVEIVDILGDDALEAAELFEFRQGAVGGVRLFAQQHLAQGPEQFPGLGRSAVKDLKGGVFFRRENGPETARATKIGNTAAHRDAGSGEGNGFVGSTQPFGCLFIERGVRIAGVAWHGDRRLR